MKSIKFFAVTSAVALLSTAGFTSCNQKNGPDGPNNLTEGEVVKTEFSIAFPEAVGAQGKVMRMQGTEVQADGTVASFRGMDNMVLIPFSVDSALSGSPRSGSNVNLPGTPANSLASDDITDKGAKVYTNVTIPIGTRGFLFYAKAIDNAAGEAIVSDADKHKFGTLTPQNLTAANPSTMGFDLVQINDNATPAKGIAIVKYLNQILSATDGTTAWKDSSDPYPALYSFYTLFTQLSAGSSASVQRTVGDLAGLLRNYKKTGTTYGMGIVEALLDSIKLGATLSSDTTSITLNDALAGYPADIKLPDGAAGLSYNSSDKKFELASTTNANGMTINDDPHHGLCNYVYPASLYYFANSAIKVSKTSKASLYDAGNYWKTILAAYTDGNEVALTTRSVAIEDSIQYAVGRLDLKVKIVGASGDKDQLIDNDPQVVGGRTIDLSSISVTSIPVTAVLIGGQKNVDYHFIPKTGDQPVWTIYDNAVPSGFAAPINSWSTETNYTLALETAENAHVKFALELQNNLGDFIGQGGQLIPAGSKFYLVGELNPESATAEEKAKTDSRVFKQDFNTTANVTLGETCLKSAYNTIPDLRTSQLELGLSVDLQWQTGMIFDVTL